MLEVTLLVVIHEREIEYHVTNFTDSFNTYHKTKQMDQL